MARSLSWRVSASVCVDGIMVPTCPCGSGLGCLGRNRRCDPSRPFRWRSVSTGLCASCGTDDACLGGAMVPQLQGARGGAWARCWVSSWFRSHARGRASQEGRSQRCPTGPRPTGPRRRSPRREWERRAWPSRARGGGGSSLRMGGGSVRRRTATQQLGSAKERVWYSRPAWARPGSVATVVSEKELKKNYDAPD